MKALLFETFQGPLAVESVADPRPSEAGVVIAVMATGLCRSDWHGWMGHDADISLPHVPGHELAGKVVEVGAAVSRWQVGDRVTVPFVCGCGVCPPCAAGHQHICDFQFQPGFTHWGSFAEYVAIDYADGNLVRLPEEVSFTTAASLGCRFATAFRAVVDQGRLTAGQWLAVHGCGGVGLSAIMIARACGAMTVAVDIARDKLDLATAVGADITIDANEVEDVPAAVKAVCGGGAQLSVDALGSRVTAVNSIRCLRKRGRHIQVGLMAGAEADPAIPLSTVIADELEILGSHGMQAHRYPAMLTMIRKGRLQPQRLINKTVDLSAAAVELTTMNEFPGSGIVVVDRF